MRKESANMWPARLLGSGLAHLQHGIDGIVKVGIRAVRTLGNAPEPKKSDTIPAKAVSIGKSVLRFVGKLGDTYFEEYEKLKRDRQR